MKKLVLFFLVLTPFFIKGQSKKVKSILDKTIEIMKANSVNSKTVDWNKLTSEAYRLAENTKSPYELGNSIRFLYQSLDDFHGSFRYKDSIFRWVKEKKPVPSLYKTEFAKKGNKFFTRQLNNIGYLRIPTSLVSVAKERTRELQDSLCKILAKNPEGLIFDLRLNGGGHVFCMVMGVSNILQYGPVAPGDEITKDGFYRKDPDGALKNIHVFKETCERTHLDIPIAVIVGPYTGSSAEGLAIILKNRPNTILIGEPTAGWVTSVLGMSVDRNAHINLSVGYMTDIKNTVYKTSIQPEIFVQGGDDFVNLTEDAKVVKAIEWLKSKK